jgi:hypothetical protein
MHDSRLPISWSCWGDLNVEGNHEGGNSGAAMGGGIKGVRKAKADGGEIKMLGLFKSCEDFCI